MKETCNLYLQQIDNSVKSDPKMFWSFINSKEKSDLISPNMTYNRASLSDPKNIINGFVDYFAQSFVSLNRSIDSILLGLNKNVLNIKCVSDESVYNAIKKLKSKMTNRGYPQELLLDRFGLSSFLTRCIQHSVILLFKILNGIQECPAILHNIYFRVNRVNAHSKNTFYLPTSRTSNIISLPLIQMLSSYMNMEDS
ncbi:hypothetical protein BDFB_010716, partial [Asbolus verrucosus]